MLATANDLRELIHYLKKHPDGVTIVEALGEVKKRILDPRKISAYEAWGVVDRQGDWLKLSDLGWEFSRKLAAEAALFRSILDRVEPYRTVLELAHSQQLKLITQEDIARFWRAHYSDTLTMRRSDAGLFVVTQEDCQLDEQGSWMLKPEVQAEISAAYLFYNRRVLLLWDERVPVPSDWQNITRCTFVGEELTWEMGLQLAKALLAFKR